MKFLISGASGFVGTYLQQHLLENDHDIELIRPDHIEAIKQSVLKYDCLIHLAGRAHVMHETAEDVYQAYREVNVDYMLKVAALARSLGIKRFVFLSSVKVNGESSTTPFSEVDSPQPEDDYGKTKLEAELALKAFCETNGIEWVIIRPPLIYGPGVKANFKSLIQLCDYPLPLPLGAIDNKRSLVSLDNLAHFIELCCTHPKAANQTFLISDNHDVSTTELVRTIKLALDRKPMLIPVPQQLLHWLFKVLGKQNLSARLLGDLQVDISKAEQLLGWKPVIGFKEGIQHTVKHYAD